MCLKFLKYLVYIFLKGLFNTCITEQECDPVDGNVTAALNADDDEEEDDEDCFTNDESQENVLKNCFLAMVDTLSTQVFHYLYIIILKKYYYWLFYNINKYKSFKKQSSNVN